MATSNETRVRVEGLSKIIASVLPASGFGRRRPRPAPSWRGRGRGCGAGSAAANRRADRENGERLRHSRSAAAHPLRLLRAAPQRVDVLDRLAHVGSSSMISGGSRRTTLSPAATVSSCLRAQFRHEIAVRALHLSPSISPMPRISAKTCGYAPSSASFCSQIGPCRAHGRGNPAPAPRRARRCRPPSPADCRQRWSHACRPSCPAGSSVARQAPTGKPPPSALGERHDVGRDAGIHSWANNLPVRPMPV